MLLATASIAVMFALPPEEAEKQARKEPPVQLAVSEVVDTAEVPAVVRAAAPAAGAPNFGKLTQQLQQFRVDFVPIKQQILDHEKAYIFIGEKPEEALKDKPKSQKMLRKTKKWVDQLESKMRKRMKILDTKLVQADQYCETAQANEAKCTAFADAVHYYEASVSQYIGMMEVMQKRHDAAAEVLK